MAQGCIHNTQPIAKRSNNIQKTMVIHANVAVYLGYILTTEIFKEVGKIIYPRIYSGTCYSVRLKIRTPVQTGH